MYIYSICRFDPPVNWRLPGSIS